MRRCGCSLRPWPRCAPRSEAGTALASSGLSRREGGAGDEGGLERLPQPAREWASPGPEHGRTGSGTPGRRLCSRAPRRRATLNQGETPRGPLLSTPILDSGRCTLQQRQTSERLPHGSHLAMHTGIAEEYHTSPGGGNRLRSPVSHTGVTLLSFAPRSLGQYPRPPRECLPSLQGTFEAPAVRSPASPHSAQHGFKLGASLAPLSIS